MTMAKFASHHVGVFHFVHTVPIVYFFFKFSKVTICSPCQFFHHYHLWSTCKIINPMAARILTGLLSSMCSLHGFDYCIWNTRTLWEKSIIVDGVIVCKWSFTYLSINRLYSMKPFHSSLEMTSKQWAKPLFPSFCSIYICVKIFLKSL